MLQFLSHVLLLSAVISRVAADEQLPLGKHAAQKPNIVVILTDDQDLHMQSLHYMPLLKKYVADYGTNFTRHYCSTALCCPSRVTLWTGRYNHNTNVTDVTPPYGGYPKFVAEGLNDAWLPVWLQNEGYSTFYTGKLFNSHTVANYDSPYPAGWTSSDFLLDPFTYEYLNATFQKDKEKPVSWEGSYSTDVLAHKGYLLLEQAVELNKPFFLTLAPIGPHSNVAHDASRNAQGFPEMTAPVSAERHKHLFPDAKVPRTENFNPDTAGGAAWIKHLGPLNESHIEYNDHFYRKRLQALQAVDELVAGVVERLQTYGILDNTYVIYTTDNGFHIGQHRLPPGKECAFEEDVNIPFIVRGPNVPVGHTTNVVTAHVDFAATIMGLAGNKSSMDFDGKPIPLTAKEIEKESENRLEHVNVEFWGMALAEGTGGFSLDEGKNVYFGLNNTYKAIRVIGQDYDLMYSVWCTNEHELYDMTTDPYQIRNIYPSDTSTQTTLLDRPIQNVIQRLDALLMITKSCKGKSCTAPWDSIHPQGSVKSLADALKPEYNAFYAYVGENVGFDRCELGHILDAEGPQKVPVFDERVWGGGGEL